ncbi:alpha-mannosidase 2 [Caerostris extrusa]|uniref:Alpha-mannosidase n=1 Tax=Caerostris extrusa TaxID=172846 RepID=A0AAV4TVJ9_CAEEX|nr:alpha-mannosidase 2 [Caerostris extrusa]
MPKLILLRVFQKPRTKYLISIVILAFVSIAILYHTIGNKQNPTPASHTDSVRNSEISLQVVEQIDAEVEIVKVKSRQKLPCDPLPPLKNVDLNTPDVYPLLNFKPPYRSYWNYTFEKRYLKVRENWNKLPLQVIIVPHSHNDPGWLKTFDGYFMAYTAHILNNMADKLAKYKDMTFVWSEISFFSRWWNSLKNRPHLRDQVRQFLRKGQLEILTGGWVMTDEAAAHIYGMVDQLIEGHQWMKTNLGITPRSAWSVDSFGHSSTVAYMLRATGMRNMVIQRTHYAWKAYLAEKRQLNFFWRQEFDNLSPSNHSSDIMCQMMPFDLYSIKHSCGPDPDVCLQFDFRRIPGEYSESRASPVTPEKVAEMSDLLLGQYGRIGSLFPHNVVLIPLGDDFRYNHDTEWDQQYENYAKIMEYINSRSDWNANVRFGTLRDYFNLVHKRMHSIGYENIPSLTGDFHTYGDIYGEGHPSYWSGYFTTRPYWKHMCRDLQHWLRGAEILFSFSRAFAAQHNLLHLLRRLDQDYAYLTLARDSLGLFQHHDAITGTSKEAVTADYGMRLFRGIKETKGIIAHAVLYVMAEEAVKRSVDLRPAHPLTSYLYPDIDQSQYDKLPEKVPLSIPSQGRKVVIFNSKARRVSEPVRLRVGNAFVKVLGPDGEEIPIQINPAWNGSVAVLGDVYELLFIAELSPLSLTTFTVISTDRVSRPRSQVAITLNDAFAKQPHNSIFSFQSPSDVDIELATPLINARFSKQSGLLQSIELKDYNVINKVALVLQAYRSEEFRSGAYLFHPLTNDPVQNISGRFPIIRIVKGPICSEVTAVYSNVVMVTQRVYHSSSPLGNGVELEVTSDIAQLFDVNLELFMRVKSDIKSGNSFYTDANGFQMIKRNTLSYLPLEANYYPATSAIFLEDEQSRLTVLMSQAHGVASLSSGWMEVMLDRRLRGDDNRGLGEGVMDNKRTMAQFWLLLEAVKEDSTEEVPTLSLNSHILSSLIAHPPIVVATHSFEQRNLKSKVEFLESSFPCNVELFNLRTMPAHDDFDVPSNSSLLIVHHKGVSCRVKSWDETSCTTHKENSIRLDFKTVQLSSVHKTSLTGIMSEGKVWNSTVVHLSPMELTSFNVTFRT